MDIRMKYQVPCLLIVLILAACGTVPGTGIIPIPTGTNTPVSPQASPTPQAARLIPTLPASPIPSPSATATPALVSSGPFRVVASLSGMLEPTSRVVLVRPLADGSAWIITESSALHWDGQAWQAPLSPRENLLADVDDQGLLWVLSQDNRVISSLKGEDWIDYTAGKGWSEVGFYEKNWWSPEPWRVYSGMKGSLWVAMSQDVRSFAGSRWTVYTLEDMGFPVPQDQEASVVNNLALANSHGEVWVGQCYYSGPGPVGGGGVRWYDGNAWQGADAPLGAGCVSVVQVDSAGDVWVGAGDIIWRYEHDGQTWTDYPLPAGLLAGYNFTHPLKLIVDQAGDVWVAMQMCGGASCDGRVNLYRIHNGEWSLAIDAEYWLSSFKQLLLDGSGQGWLFWDGSLYQLGDLPLEPLAEVKAMSASLGPDGKIWVVADTRGIPSLLVLTP